MCNDAETSKEHAPPKCLFPTESEAGCDLRVNLITVPSCDKHNSEKSKDDEFLRAVLLGVSAHNSPVAADHFRGKLLRAAARNPTTYGTYFDEQGKVQDGLFQALRIDRDRLDTCIAHIARAIYYYETRLKWQLPIFIISPNLFSTIENGEVQPHEPSEQGIELARQYLAESPTKGSNSEVFQYKTRHESEREIYVFAAIFYKSFEVYCYSSKDLAEAAI
jgi:hypothetical protein